MNTPINDTGIAQNGIKAALAVPKNKYVTTIEEPALNESGIEAKKKGF